MIENRMIEWLIQRYDKICDLPVVLEIFGQRDYMNYGYWDEQTHSQKEACDNLMERLLSYIPDKRGTILDVACGKGETTAFLLKYYQPENVTGINISEKQLEIARAKAPGCTFLKMDAARLNFPEDSFDNILCVEAAFHFDTRENFFKSAHSVLRKGGRLVLSDIIMTLEGERDRRGRTEKNFIRDLDEYQKLFRRAGFGELELVDATECCWKPHFWYAVRFFHQKFLSGEIRLEELESYIEGTLNRVNYTKYYVLAAATKSE